MINMQYKYEYKGMSINDYCELHNIKKFTIYSRIRKVKLENPNLDQDELVNEAFKRYYAHEHILYFYNNTALYNYCLKNPDIKYKRIRL